jgi:small subunit ribosomal protein S17
MEESVENKKKKTISGTVMSDKMDKTVTVRIERKYRHPMFGKIVRAWSKVYAHDEDNIYQIGDIVRLEQSRPLSKLKRWNVIEKIK